jgi:methylmalonyl-CoA mutase cobalamin-binding subunit
MSKTMQAATDDGAHAPCFAANQAANPCAASQVLTAVSRRMPRPVPPPSIAFSPEADDHLAALAEALVASESLFQQRIGRIMRLHGVSAETLIDDYIPHLAHQLGAEWSADTRSFAEVTICMARLNAAVRDLSRAWVADNAGAWSAPRMGLILPENEQHTLGAAIAASRLRRLGVSVQVMSGRADHEIVDTVRRLDLDLVAISVSTTDRLETARKLVKMLRRFVTNLPPLVVGGAISGDEWELKAYLDVDHITSDPVEALRRCGLMARLRGNTMQPAAG